MTDVLKFPQPPREIVVRTDAPHEPLRQEIEKLLTELREQRAAIASFEAELRSAPVLQKLDQVLEAITKRIGVIAELERAAYGAEEWAAGRDPLAPRPGD